MYLLATKLVESNGKVIPVIITTDDTSYGWYLNYDSDLKKYVFTHEDGSFIYNTCIYLFKIID